jgi:hypothetical protein
MAVRSVPRLPKSPRLTQVTEAAQTAEIDGERRQVTLEVPNREGVVRVGDRRQFCVEGRATHGSGEFG